MARTARIERSTKESSVLVELNLDGTGQIDIETGVPFLIICFLSWDVTADSI